MWEFCIGGPNRLSILLVSSRAIESLVLYTDPIDVMGPYASNCLEDCRGTCGWFLNERGDLAEGFSM
jgi:hypothetical protein